MEKRVSVILLTTMAVFVLSNGADVKDKDGKIFVDEVDRRLQLLNKHAVKSITSEDGDIIDCVDIYSQPAFDLPALKNHTIQMKPSFEHESSSSSITTVIFQTWQKSGSCPNGTIPIRRIRREDLLRADSTEEFGKKPPFVSHPTNKSTNAKHTPFSSSNNSKDLAFHTGTLVNRSIAQLMTVGFNYIGAKGQINIWNPRVETVGEYTTAQIWLKAGPGENFESMESGWMVNPKLYGDRQTRLFAYWTKDAYKITGCFDLTCSGFIQTDPKIALGAAISPWSSPYGQQYEITLGIYRDQRTGNWWLKVNEIIAIGYWPATLFNYLKHSAIFVAWGGEVYSPHVKKTPHTKTAMGSGAFARSLSGLACYIKHPRINDYSLQLKYPSWVAENADEYYCYSAYNYRQGIVGEPVFYFGGPGQNPPYCR